jgi:hypothetical protein
MARIWVDLDSNLAGDSTRQMTRCHAAAQSVQQTDSGNRSEHASLLVLLHPQDTTSKAAAARYEAGLVTAERTHAGWDEFVTIGASVGALDAEESDILRSRYVDLGSAR